jgi:hypothetical protein
VLDPFDPAAPPRVVVSRSRPPEVAYEVADALGGVMIPMGSAGFAELAGAVERVDDPQATVSRDVLEPLLRTDVVFGIEPVQLLDEELMGHPVPRRPEFATDGAPFSQLEQGPTGHGGQGRRILVLGGQVLLFDVGHDAHV